METIEKLSGSARHQLSARGVPSAMGLVERRPRTRQLRIGAARIEELKL